MKDRWRWRLELYYPAEWYFAYRREGSIIADEFFEQEMKYFGAKNTGAGMGFSIRDLSFDFPTKQAVEAAAAYIKECYDDLGVETEVWDDETSLC
jgi:hypothetical protein